MFGCSSGSGSRTTTTSGMLPAYNEHATTTSTTSASTIPYVIPTVSYIPIYECVADSDCSKDLCYTDRNGYCVDKDYYCDLDTHTCEYMLNTNVGRGYSCVALASGASRCV
jgi:hypothetical protein